MKILAVDIGTGTQDIFLFDSNLDLENGFKLVVPSPTMMIYRRLKEATRQHQGVVLTGVTMGGGPSSWGAEGLIRAGLPVLATPPAARSFNDDLEAVRGMGVEVIGEEEVAHLPQDLLRVELRDFDYPAIVAAFSQFGVSLSGLGAIGVAVFDHGNSPPDYSDRQFRFDYLDQRIRSENRLSAFAYPANTIPPIMTRLQAVALSAEGVDAPLVVMDTAPAAVLGATFDPRVAERERVLIANIGNFHTLAFRLGPGGIEGVFEHHTGLLDLARLEALLRSLANGSLKHDDVFGDHGHGALIYDPEPLPLGVGGYDVAVTGPRRNLFRTVSSSRQTERLKDSPAIDGLRPYFAAPFGDMMIAGCFGLLKAVGDAMPELKSEIESALLSGGGGRSPWEVE